MLNSTNVVIFSLQQKRVGTSGTGRTTLVDYIWYARELRLARTAVRMTDQLQEYINRRIVTSDEDFLGFDNTDKANEHFVPAIEEVAAGLKRERIRELELEEDETGKNRSRKC
uniref:Uncharacterized protein n=1 Tax=Glossina austeni TaxID=7395 RepID=A0A1A9UWW6_GLOAU